MSNQILVVDDERAFLETIKRGLFISGYKQVTMEINPKAALALFEQGERFDAALIDITMPEMDGVILLEKIKSISPHTECIMVTALNEAQRAMECIRKGAYDYLVKPITKDDLTLCLDRALERRRLLKILDIRKRACFKDLNKPEAFAGIVTQSPEVIRVLKEAELHAASNVPVLITGESGTGKELLAQAVHMASLRSHAPFTAINMASMSASLFDAEFFGHTKGAFTGAQSERQGYLSVTHKGSLFLDEIGSLPMDLQGKLLRVLQEGEHLPIGRDQPVKTDLRFIAATNEDIEEKISLKTFRKDLYYRLKGAWLHLPSLKERKGDIPLLAAHFLAASDHNSGEPLFHPDTMALLEAYPYPGNIRELKSIVQGAFNLSRGRTILVDHLPSHFRHQPIPSGTEQGTWVVQPLEELEKQYVLKVYNHTGKNKSRTSALLGIGLNTLRRKLRTYGMK